MTTTTSAAPAHQLADVGRAALTRRREQQRVEHERLVAEAKQALAAAELEHAAARQAAEAALAPSFRALQQARERAAGAEAAAEAADRAAFLKLVGMLSPEEVAGIERWRCDVNFTLDKLRNGIGSNPTEEACRKIALRIKPLQQVACEVPDLRTHPDPLGEIRRLRSKLDVEDQS